jgi:hypothetical protein
MLEYARGGELKQVRFSNSNYFNIFIYLFIIAYDIA